MDNAVRLTPRLTTTTFGTAEGAIYVNGVLLVGTSWDEDAGEIIVGFWPDGEQWTELFRVPSTFRTGEDQASDC
jgi:hypothetical protein